MKMFELAVDANKDGQELYRVRAESLSDVMEFVRQRAVGDFTNEDRFEYLRDSNMSTLTLNWSDVSERDVREVDPAHVPVPPELVRAAIPLAETIIRAIRDNTPDQTGAGIVRIIAANIAQFTAGVQQIAATDLAKHAADQHSSPND